METPNVLPGPSGPLPVSGQQTSELFDINLPAGEKTFYLRFVALFRDNEPLGGEAPTFQIKAGTGELISVGPNSGRVSVLGGGGNVVASVACKRFPQDVFLLTISDIAENSGTPWKMRIRNNDSESLRFLGFSSTEAENTLQPWLLIGGPNDCRLPNESFFRMYNAQPFTIEVRNLGTAPLTFFEDTGPLGEDESVSLKERPARVEVHGLKKLMFKCELHTDTRIVHFMNCNDPIKENTRVELVISGQRFPPPTPPSTGGGGGTEGSGSTTPPWQLT
jgi:hypothetical protein